MKSFLLRVEGVDMASSVYDTQDLGCLQGASLALLASPSQVEQALPPTAKMMFSGASQGLFRVEAEDEASAEAIAECVRKSLTQGVFRHLRFVVDVVPDDGLDAENRAWSRNRVRQMRSLSVVLPDEVPGAQTYCPIDRVRPASCPDREADLENQTALVSASVKARRAYRRERRWTFYRDEIGVDPALLPGPSDEFARSFEDVVPPPPARVPEALHHKMAVLYFDGNRFGKIRENLGAERFSTELKDLRRCLMGKMIPALGGLNRAETLLWGGDEMMWVAPAWRMIDSLSAFFTATNGWPHGMTHAGGVVVCHYKTPIRQVAALAHELADLAKAEGGRDRTSVQVEILESLDIPEGYLSRQRRRLFGDVSGFTLFAEEWDELLVSMRKARKDFPRSQLYALLQKARDKGGLTGSRPETIEPLMQDLEKILKSGGYGVSSHDLVGNAPLAGERDSRLFRLARLAAFWDYLVDETDIAETRP